MRAMVAEGFEGYSSLKIIERDRPVPGENELLVRIAAAGVTPLDYTILSGHYPKAKHRSCWAMKAPALLLPQETPYSRREHR